MKYYIYKTTNLINGKYYIGQRTIKNGLINDDSYLGSGRILQKAIKKYGKDNFKKDIIAICNDRAELDRAETFWIAKLNSFVPNGYNISTGGHNGDNFSNDPNKEERKMKMSISMHKKYKDENYMSKFKMRMANSKKWQDAVRSNEQRKKISKGNTGKKRSDIAKQNYSKAIKGRIYSNEHNKKVSVGMSNYFNNNPDAKIHLSNLAKLRTGILAPNSYTRIISNLIKKIDYRKFDDIEEE